MLNWVAFEYCTIIDNVTGNKTLKLCQYELDDRDWDIVKDLLQVLKNVTLFFSQDDIVTITNVVPTMDQLDAMLSSSATTPLVPVVKHALTFACQLMDKYYSKTDLSNVYCISMVLHPQLKLKYFQQHAWEKDWIQTAEGIVRDELQILESLAIAIRFHASSCTFCVLILLSTLLLTSHLA
ncbi:hypothetical protein F5148DRAFT_982533 [Russula earlei]|uniref:Uncharacterized protein n=1 Tax=Russula earlei TaxID=71964 RepID=A0ACC0U4K5_9AGAM|nr:hypothetical protein F5148DRAFT_982533 [Russula earlei]